MLDSQSNLTTQEEIVSASQQERSNESSSSQPLIPPSAQRSSASCAEAGSEQYASAAPAPDAEASGREQDEAANDIAAANKELVGESNAELAEGTESASGEPEPPPVTLEDLSIEIRRLGRELFKVNRALGYNQETFESAFDEMRRVTAGVSQILAQRADTLFEAKAPLCRELLSVVDSLEASIETSEDVIERLEENADQPASGLFSKIPAVRKLKAALAESTDGMEQWRHGQELLLDRLRLALRAAGVREVSARDGQRFDPEVHRAVSTEERDDVPSGTIVGEELKGYSLDGKILRYAEVIVAKNEPNSWD